MVIRRAGLRERIQRQVLGSRMWYSSWLALQAASGASAQLEVRWALAAQLDPWR